MSDHQGAEHPVTTDGRYLVVRGRLWRMSDPALDAERKRGLVSELMSARSAVRTGLRAADREAVRAARDRVDEVKCLLGERGSVWWTDGAPDYNRHMVRNTPYADWFERFMLQRK